MGVESVDPGGPIGRGERRAGGLGARGRERSPRGAARVPGGHSPRAAAPGGGRGARRGGPRAGLRNLVWAARKAGASVGASRRCCVRAGRLPSAGLGRAEGGGAEEPEGQAPRRVARPGSGDPRAPTPNHGPTPTDPAAA